MKTTFIRPFLVLLAIVAVLILIFFIALPSLINTSAIKQELVDKVKDASGQELNIEGDLSLALFPNLSINSGKLSLSQPEGLDTEQPFISADSLSIAVKLLPLLNKQLEISNFHLDGAQLYYLVEKDGKTSLDGFSAAESNTEPSNEPDQASDNNSLLNFKLGGLKLTNARLSIDNRVDNQQLSIDQIQLSTGPLGGDPLGGQQTSPIAFSATITPHQQAPIKLTANTRLQWLPNEQLLNAVDTELGIDTGRALKMLKLKSSAIAIDLGNKEIQLPFSLFSSISDAELKGTVTVKDWDKQAMFKGQMETNTFKPAELLALLDSEAIFSNDGKALQTLNFSSHFSGSEKGLSLRDLDLQLDDTRVDGDLAIMNFQAPEYRFELNLDQLNTDRYLNTQKATSDASQNQQKANPGSALDLPLESLKGLDINGTLRAKNLIAQGAKVDQLTLKMATKNKRIVMTPVASLYDGRGEGSLTFIDAQQPRLLVDMRFNRINLGDLLRDTEISEQIGGRANMGLDMTLYDQNQGKPHSGLIDVAVNDGELKGVDIKGILDNGQKTIDQFRGKANTTTENTANASDKTRFTELTATLNLKDNMLRNKDLSIKGPAFRVSGKGDIALESQTLDYLSNIALVDTNSGQGGKDKADLKSFVLPVRFYGDMQAPKYRIDARELIKQNTRAETKRQKEKLKQKLREELGLNKQEEEQQDWEDSLKNKVLNELFK